MAQEFRYRPNEAVRGLKNAKELETDAPRVGAYLRRYRTNQEALAAIRADEEAGGRRAAQNPVLKFLEDDPQAALNTVRLAQLASLRSVIVIYDTETETASRAFIGIREAKGRVNYHEPQEVIDNVEVQRTLLRQLRGELTRIINHYGELREFCSDAIRLRERVQEQIDELDSLRRDSRPPPPEARPPVQ